MGGGQHCLARCASGTCLLLCRMATQAVLPDRLVLNALESSRPSLQAGKTALQAAPYCPACTQEWRERQAEC